MNSNMSCVRKIAIFTAAALAAVILFLLADILAVKLTANGYSSWMSLTLYSGGGVPIRASVLYVCLALSVSIFLAPFVIFFAQILRRVLTVAAPTNRH